MHLPPYQHVCKGVSGSGERYWEGMLSAVVIISFENCLPHVSREVISMCSIKLEDTLDSDGSGAGALAKLTFFAK